MRCWHKDLIPYLPRQQLLGQWRECCLIAKNIAEKGTPGHLLVNKITDYPPEHFASYCNLVCTEMEARGYKCDFHKIERYLSDEYTDPDYIFPNWHNLRYLGQCYRNLEEKYDCGGMSKSDFKEIEHLYLRKLKEA